MVSASDKDPPNEVKADSTNLRTHTDRQFNRVFISAKDMERAVEFAVENVVIEPHTLPDVNRSHAEKHLLL